MLIIVLLFLAAPVTCLMNNRWKRNAVQDGRKLWHGKIIPYSIDPYIWNVTAINESIIYFNKLTCVQWVERSKVDINLPYVIFKPDSVCRSEVGQTDSAIDGQSIFIGPRCNHQPIILHEMYHVMGFYHEMKRYDRDKYVEIHWDNILPGYESFFSKMPQETTNLLNEKYDVTSVMHYGSFSYSTQSNRRTISLVGSDRILPEDNMPNKQDIERVMRLYDCRADAVEGWAKWSSYGACDNQCYKRKTRFCYSSDVTNACNEIDASTQTEVSKCDDRECSRDGWWSKWSTWSSCNVYCGNGKQRRYRQCNDPPPRLYGKNCTGMFEEYMTCRRGSCVRGKYDCDFDNDGTCHWLIQGGWRRSQSGTIEEGPKTDVSFLIGYYMFLRKNLSGKMSLQLSSKDALKCMNFFYDSIIKTNFKIILHEVSGNTRTMEVNSNSKDGWKYAQLSVSDVIKVDITGHTSNTSFIAIDDVTFTVHACETSTDHIITVNKEQSTTARPVSSSSTTPLMQFPTSTVFSSTTTTRTRTERTGKQEIGTSTRSTKHKKTMQDSYSSGSKLKDEITYLIYFFILYLNFQL